MAKPSRKAHEHNKTFFAKPVPGSRAKIDTREEARQRLAADAAEYLSTGGEITVCKSKEPERGGCSRWSTGRASGSDRDVEVNA